MKTFNQAIEKLWALYDETKKELVEQRELSAAPGNAYICGLSGKLTGLKLAIEVLSTVEVKNETK